MQITEKAFFKALSMLPQIGYNKLVVSVKSNSPLFVTARKENETTNLSLGVILAMAYQVAGCRSSPGGHRVALLDTSNSYFAS